MHDFCSFLLLAQFFFSLIIILVNYITINCFTLDKTIRIIVVEIEIVGARVMIIRVSVMKVRRMGAIRLLRSAPIIPLFYRFEMR